MTFSNHSIMLFPSTFLISEHFLLSEYFFIFVFLCVSLVLSCVIFALSYFLSSRSIDKEKISAYECGFNP